MKRADAFLALLRSGMSTLEIAKLYDMSESGVYNSMHSARLARKLTNAERCRRYYAANRHAIKLRRCGIDPNTVRASSPFSHGLAGGAELLPSPASAF